LAVRLARLGEARVDTGVVSHVDSAEHPADLCRVRLARFGVEIEDRDFHPLGRERPRRRCTQTSRRTHHYRSHAAVETHA
jgi:hypothetical protein